MNRLRCFFLTAIVVISSSILALGGDIQGPVRSEPPPPPTPSASTTSDLTQPMSTEETQLVWQDTTMLVELLLLII